MKHLFFDLDGTLVNSSPGIKSAFRYAFQNMGWEIPNDEELETFIGPPLESTFPRFTQSQDEVKQAINLFRSYYEKEGVYQVTLYDGIVDSLSQIKEKGYHLYITTSKNEPMALLMIKNLNIDNYFTGIYGALPDSHDKDQVLSRAIKEHNINKVDAIIIGDTKYDIIGGKKVGIETLAVTWGFGKLTDLKSSGANNWINHPSELIEYFKKNR